MKNAPPIENRYTPDSLALVQFWVPGKPRQQGSKRPMIRPTGGIYMKEMAKGLGDWRHDVKSFAMDQMEGKEMITDVAVFVHAFFVMPRTVALKEKHPTPPAIKKNGDLDKLTRGIYDAMTGIVYADDCLVTEQFEDKRIAEWGEQPGCWVSVGRRREWL